MKNDKMLENAVQEAFDNEKGVRSWEDFYGIDSPGYLPYWLMYMPKKERYAYLLDAGYEFLDFSIEMLKDDFDWKKWECFTPEYAYVFIPDWVKYIEFDNKVDYLLRNKEMLKDFTEDMLDESFDWNNWNSQLIV